MNLESFGSAEHAIGEVLSLRLSYMYLNTEDYMDRSSVLILVRGTLELLAWNQFGWASHGVLMQTDDIYGCNVVLQLKTREILMLHLGFSTLVTLFISVLLFDFLAPLNLVPNAHHLYLCRQLLIVCCDCVQ
jgi:hypothetical protein